jgi:hypothetical protein
LIEPKPSRSPPKPVEEGGVFDDPPIFRPKILKGSLLLDGATGGDVGFEPKLNPPRPELKISD